MVTANYSRIEELSNSREESLLNEDARNEVLRLQMLENRRIQQVNLLRRHLGFKNYSFS